MLISAVIPTYKREHLLGEAVMSILSQDAPNVDIEIVVVNDNGGPLPTPTGRMIRASW